MRTILLAAALSLGGCAAMPPPPPRAAPVNILSAQANWRDDVGTCKRYMVANTTPAPVVEDHPTATVCNAYGQMVQCQDVGSSGGWAAGYSQTRRALGGDGQDRVRVFYQCMNALGWRQP